LAPGTRASALEIPIPLDVRPITPDVARQLNLRGAEGVLVFGAEDESPAADAGLQRGQHSLYGPSPSPKADHNSEGAPPPSRKI